jgi:hypothetical protein
MPAPARRSKGGRERRFLVSGVGSDFAQVRAREPGLKFWQQYGASGKRAAPPLNGF